MRRKNHFPNILLAEFILFKVHCQFTDKKLCIKRFADSRINLLIDFCNRLPELYLKATPQEKRLIVTTIIHKIEYFDRALTVELKPIFEQFRGIKNAETQTPSQKTQNRPMSFGVIIVTRDSRVLAKYEPYTSLCRVERSEMELFGISRKNLPDGRLKLWCAQR